jgi:hypothetical protein
MTLDQLEGEAVAGTPSAASSTGAAGPAGPVGPTSGSGWLGPWVRRNSLAFGIGIFSIVGTMLMVFFEPLVTEGKHVWLLSGPGDLWVQWRAAGVLPNPGGYTDIYQFDALLKTPPLWELLISPIAHRFLAWPFPYVPGGWGIAHPKVVFIAGPTELAAVPFCICAVDVWLRRLGASVRRRVGALLVLAVVLPPAALWGHPEDLMALGCALLALRAVRENRWSAGWWMGVALAFQEEAILVLPLCLVLLATNRRRLTFFAQSLVVPLVVMLPPLIGSFRVTTHALLHQKVFDGGIRYTPVRQLFPDSAVASDLFTMALAIVVAAVVWRLRDRISDATAFWLVGALYCLRLLYPSLYPYYLIPAMAVFVALTAISTRPRYAAALALGVGMTWWLQYVTTQSSWLHWTAAAYPLAIMGALAFPLAAARRVVSAEAGAGAGAGEAAEDPHPVLVSSQAAGGMPPPVPPPEPVGAAPA